MFRHRVFLFAFALSAITLLFSCAPSAERTAVDTAAMGAAYNGRWNVELEPADRGRVGWYQIEKAGTPEAAGLVVGAPGGGMYPFTEINVLPDGQLQMIYTARWGSNIPEIGQQERAAARAARDRGEEPVRNPEVRAVYTAKLENDILVGKTEWPDAPERFRPVTWKAKRAPEITETDDGTWVPGETVDLVDGKRSDTFTVALPNEEIRWSIQNGILANNPPAGNLESKDKFWNFDLHAEYRLSEHSNSGIGLRGRYEVQIMEDFGKEPYKQGHGAVYYRIVPTSNPSKKVGEWQTMDVRLIGREVSVMLNGVKIIDRKIIDGLTAMATNANEGEPGPITIQGDHEKVEFRKLTVTRLEKKAN
ncbi:MAG: DUF1080 domain-containing protein [Bryobacterales bacterium]|nr:DUF1080 domain-containing protein [Bryobacterales bacterium]